MEKEIKEREEITIKHHQAKRTASIPSHDITFQIHPWGRNWAGDDYLAILLQIGASTRSLYDPVLLPTNDEELSDMLPRDNLFTLYLRTEFQYKTVQRTR